MRLVPLLAALAALASLVPAAAAATYVLNADARPRVADGRIVTDAYDDATGAFAAGVEHFGYQVGRSPGNPYFTADPGFNAVLGSGLPVGQQLRFDAVRRLVRWDGAAGGPVRFLAVPGGESLRFNLGASEAIVAGGSDAVAGFSLGNVASGGAIHRHLNATLRGGPDAGAPPAPGLYFTALRLRVGNDAVARSDALYVAYNVGLDAAAFDRGMTALANPLPGDANFDARVDFADLVILAQRYGTVGDASFFDGDFDGDRAVGFADLVALAQNYGDGAAAALGDDWALARSRVGSDVPEPAASLALAAAATACRRTRRREACERR